MQQYIAIGKIVSSQGNKGEVKVFPLTDFPERFEHLAEIYLERDGSLNVQEIEGVRYHKNHIILKIAGVDDIEQALMLKDHYIKIPEEQLIPLAENSFYIHQIIGYTVVCESGEKLGELKDVLPTGGADLFLVQGPQKEYMIPAARDIIVGVDRESELITVSPIPGLLEL